MNITTDSNLTAHRRPFDYIGHILYIVEGSGMLMANGLIIITLLYHRTMRRQKLNTLVALAIGDGLYGVGILIGGIRRLYLVLMRTDRLPMSAWECMLQPPTIFYIAGSQMTALAMVLISIDRGAAVICTQWYLRNGGKSSKPVNTVIVFGVATSLLAVAGSYFGCGDDSTHLAKWTALCLSTWAVPKWYATGYTAFVAISGYVSVSIYAIVLVVFRTCGRVHGGDNAQEGNNLLRIKLRRERRVTITMGFVTLMTLLFHSIPYTVIILTTMLDLKSALVAVLNPLLWSLVCINSLVNLFIYMQRHRDIRSAILDVIHARLTSMPPAVTTFRFRGLSSPGSHTVPSARPLTVLAPSIVDEREPHIHVELVEIANRSAQNLADKSLRRLSKSIDQIETSFL